jgi:RNA polymerase subunit RPABC4/transcription elongation factor Spt4
MVKEHFEFIKIKYYAAIQNEGEKVEKFYCEHCRLLYNEEGICKVCGSAAGKKIIINVQTQDISSEKSRE